MRVVSVVAVGIIFIGMAASFSMSNSSGKEAPASGQTAETPCEQYKNRVLPKRFVVLECLDDNESYGTAYVYDTVRKKCFLVHSGGYSLTLTDVTCDNLPVVPE